MRLSKHQQVLIKRTAAELFAGNAVEVILFGSRVDDRQRGGDIDLMVKTGASIEHPAVMAARLSTRLSALLDGRKVDVIIQSPALKQLPIHAIAEKTGVRL